MPHAEKGSIIESDPLNNIFCQDGQYTYSKRCVTFCLLHFRDWRIESLPDHLRGLPRIRSQLKAKGWLRADGRLAFWL